MAQRGSVLVGLKNISFTSSSCSGSEIHLEMYTDLKTKNKKHNNKFSKKKNIAKSLNPFLFIKATQSNSLPVHTVVKYL